MGGAAPCGNAQPFPPQPTQTHGSGPPQTATAGRAAPSGFGPGGYPGFPDHFGGNPGAPYMGGVGYPGGGGGPGGRLSMCSERGEALTRYRQKRKLRHFEKTIRYESRQVSLAVLLGNHCNRNLLDATQGSAEA